MGYRTVVTVGRLVLVERGNKIFKIPARQARRSVDNAKSEDTTDASGTDSGKMAEQAVAGGIDPSPSSTDVNGQGRPRKVQVPPKSQEISCKVEDATKLP